MTDIYITDASALETQLDTLLPLLTPARADRVRRLMRTDAKCRVCAAGLLIRHVFGAEKAALVTLGEHGKPFIPGQAHFSLSHSGKYAAIAVSETPVGLDIERIRPLPQKALERFLLPDEIARCKSAEDGVRFWTMKEAVSKVSGTGFAAGAKNIPLPKEDSTIPAGEVPICLTTEVFDGYFITTAAHENGTRLIPVCADVLTSCADVQNII